MEENPEVPEEELFLDGIFECTREDLERLPEPRPQSTETLLREVERLRGIWASIPDPEERKRSLTWLDGYEQHILRVDE